MRKLSSLAFAVTTAAILSACSTPVKVSEPAPVVERPADKAAPSCPASTNTYFSEEPPKPTLKRAPRSLTISPPPAKIRPNQVPKTRQRCMSECHHRSRYSTMMTH